MSNKADKPNILFLMNDHQLHYRHGWDGGPLIQRPHFDKLAGEGVRFERAYTVCPLCTPARRSILTSLYPHQHGQLQNRPSTPFQQETYLERLAGAGYRNFYFGKWHAGGGTAADFGCEGFSLSGYGNPYLSDLYKSYLRQNGLVAPTILVERDFAREGRLPAGAPYQQTDPDGCWEHMSGIMEGSSEAHEAFFLANLACEKLQQIAASQTGPFAMRVDFWGPHQPYFPTREFADLYQPAMIPLYGNFHDSLEVKPTSYWRELNYPLGDENGRLRQPNPLSWAEWQPVLARAYAQISLVDAAGGRIIETLGKLGLAENTVIIWTADHGDGLACHGGHFNKGCYLPEELLRIPLAIRAPGLIEPGLVNDALVSNLDLAPTMLELAGTAFSRDVAGTSLLHSLNQRRRWRNEVVCETNGHDDEVIGRSIIGKRYKYVATLNDRHELYDLIQDPYELNNLIHDTQFSNIVNAFQERLLTWQGETNDFAVDLIPKE